jgi:biopolymer transport protein ExbD
MPIVRNEDDDRDPEINVVPLIDLMMFLVIFLMCAVNLKKPQKVLPIVLPAAAHAKETKLPDQIVISITEKGERYLNDFQQHLNQAPIGRGELMAYLGEVAQKNRDQPIRLDIDRKTPYTQVMDVVDNIELYGLRRIYLTSRSGFQDEHK